MESPRVLIIEDVKYRHKAQVAVLTQAGYSVQSLQPHTIEQLEDHLTSSAMDIVLYGKGENTPTLESVIALLAQHATDTPLIVLSNKPTKRSITVAENCGAAAVIQNGRSKELLQKIKKELRTAMLHRRVSRLEDEFELIRLQHRISELENT